MCGINDCLHGGSLDKSTLDVGLLLMVSLSPTIFFSIKALTVFTSLTLGNRYRKHTNSSSSATSSSSTSQITQLGKSLLISWSLFKLLQGSFLTLSLEGAVTILACKAVDVGLSICQVVIGSIWAPGLEQYHWSWTTSGSFHYRYQIRWSVVSIYVHNAARWKIYHCLGFSSAHDHNLAPLPWWQ